MKMKDHFPEAFQVDGNPSFGVQNCVWTTLGKDEQSTADQDSAIEHAVLNHDRMVEEIAELKLFAGMVANGTNEDPQGAVIHLRIHSREAKNLLAKLNQEGGE